MKFSKLIAISVFSLSFYLTASAQDGLDYKSSKVLELPKARNVKLNSINEDFSPSIKNIEQPTPGGQQYKTYLQQIKSNLPAPQPRTKPLYKKGNIAAPQQLNNFEGNRFPSGIPNDNDLAISNNGIIVSVVNSNITVLDSTGNILKSTSLAAFSDTLKLKHNKYDPRILYDPLADRFILAFLNGNHDSTNLTVLAFSKTNDPTQDWHIYTVPGNPLNDTTWSDYPIIAINKDELFLTLNALENNKSWQEGFVQSYIWQIDKSSGYSGNALKLKLHSDIKHNGKPIRNLCPVQGGSGLTNADCYLLSNRNFSAANDSIFLFKLKGRIDAPDNALSMNVIKSPTQYGVAPEAKQAVRRQLQTNDARILDAIIENGKIQFVGNSRNPNNNLAGIFHGIIINMDNNPSVNLNILGEDKLEYGYPAIAYAGKNPGDDDAVIFVNHTADSVFAGNSAFFYKNEAYSDLLRLKEGTSTIAMSGANERWGDYSGAQLRYNQPGRVWVAGTFGHTVRHNFITNLTHGTWISELQSPSGNVSVNEKPKAASFEAKTYPSPVAAFELLNVEFNLEKTTYLSFSVYDMSGKEVKQILRDRAKPGKNIFSFNINALKPGQYILRITDTENKAIVAKPFVVR